MQKQEGKNNKLCLTLKNKEVPFGEEERQRDLKREKEFANPIIGSILFLH
jgi:hypothetical protein